MIKSANEQSNQSLQASFPSFTVTVNYDKSVDNLVADGKYDRSDADITSDNFPSSEKGQATITIYLVRFDHYANRNEAINELDCLGFRPATLKELLSLVIQFPPDILKKYMIVILGSTWRNSMGYFCYPMLIYYPDEDVRRLYLDCSVIGGWYSHYRYAAVLK